MLAGGGVVVVIVLVAVAVVVVSAGAKVLCAWALSGCEIVRLDGGFMGRTLLGSIPQ